MTLPDAPLIPNDDYALHQTSETLLRVGSLHPRWTERWYFNLQDHRGRLHGIFGGGFYPNAGVLEVYACLLHDGRQLNLRQRIPATDRTDLAAAEAVTFVIDEPMRAWCMAATGPAFDLRLTFGTDFAPYLFPPFFVPADLPHEAAAAEVDEIQHFVQPGTAAATITIGGATQQVDGVSFRDRTWGIRSSRPRLHNWYVVHLDGGGYLTLIHQERADGSVMVSHAAVVTSAGEVHRYVLDSHDLRFDPVSRLLLASTFTGHDAGGDLLVVEVENVGEGVRLLGAGYDAGQGEAGGERDPQSDEWDLSDQAERARLGRGTIDSPVRATVRRAGGVATGIGITETAVARNHWRYGRLLDRSV